MVLKFLISKSLLKKAIAFFKYMIKKSNRDARGGIRECNCNNSVDRPRILSLQLTRDHNRELFATIV